MLFRNKYFSMYDVEETENDAILMYRNILGVFRIRPARYGIDCIPGMIVGPAKIDQTNNCERRVRTGGLISRHVVVSDGR